MENKQQPTRILVHASSKGQYLQKAWDSPDEVIDVALQLLRESDLVSIPTDDPPKPLFIVKERTSTRAFLVFDIFHDSYDPDTAHVDSTELPVIGVYLSGKESVSTMRSGMAKVINDKVRDIHNDTGLGSRPPFSVDYTDGKSPVYWNPRIPPVRPEVYETF